jgi:hypothetical protein
MSTKLPKSERVLREAVKAACATLADYVGSGGRIAEQTLETLRSQLDSQAVRDAIADSERRDAA